MATLGDSRRYHCRQVLETDRALNIPCINHVEDDRFNVFPINFFISIVEAKKIVISSFDYKLEGSMYAVVLGRSVMRALSLITSASISPVRCPIGSGPIPIMVFIVSAVEPKEKIRILR
jgi:hypothetical protein